MSRHSAVPAVKTCRTKPPAKYARLGATTRSDYAFPECWMYPIHMSTVAQTKKHIRAAASRFAKHHRRYPQWVQAKIRQRIDAAKRAHGIGEYRKPREAARLRRAA